MAGWSALFISYFFICLFLDHSGFRFSFKVTTQAASHLVLQRDRSCLSKSLRKVHTTHGASEVSKLRPVSHCVTGCRECSGTVCVFAACSDATLHVALHMVITHTNQ